MDWNEYSDIHKDTATIIYLILVNQRKIKCVKSKRGDEMRKINMHKNIRQRAYKRKNENLDKIGKHEEKCKPICQIYLTHEFTTKSLAYTYF